ncbi:MAG: hypothetical protein IT368_03845 [Candidatus Hydrogenedentes bacterium]|nr:hypothetical protein [Candidatus Hydrogenedentota bacterium]
MTLRLTLLCLCLAGIGVAQEAGGFVAGAVPGEYRFDTGVLRGVIREGGISIGLVPAIHTPTGTELAKTPGLLNFYRVFTTNKRFGDSMRVVESETTLTGSNTLCVRWPSAPERPFALTATYHWCAPDSLDLVTEITAAEALPDLEVFLSSYFTEAFPLPLVYARDEAGRAAFAPAPESAGIWHMFPRDDVSVTMIQDGRWAIPPNPVAWVIRPRLAAPVCLRRSTSGLTCAIFARPEDCFAIATPHAGEGHYSLYQCLFGRTLQAGEKAEARVRLVVGPLSDEAVLRRYEEFLNQSGG